MITYDYQIAQGNTAPQLFDTLTLPSPINLTNATLKLVLAKADGSGAIRTGTIVEARPSMAAAEEIDVKASLDGADVAAKAVFNIQWHFTLGDNSSYDFPPSAPAVDEEDRIYRRLLILPSLFATMTTQTQSGIVITAKTIAELREFPPSSAYLKADVLEDANGMYAVYKWVNAATDADDGQSYVRPTLFNISGVWVKIL